MAEPTMTPEERERAQRVYAKIQTVTASAPLEYVPNLEWLVNEFREAEQAAYQRGVGEPIMGDPNEMQRNWFSQGYKHGVEQEREGCAKIAKDFCDESEPENPISVKYLMNKYGTLDAEEAIRARKEEGR